MFHGGFSDLDIATVIDEKRKRQEGARIGVVEYIDVSPYFVSKFNTLLKELNPEERAVLLHGVFLHTNTPHNIFNPHTMNIMFYVTGITFERYEKYIKYCYHLAYPKHEPHDLNKDEVQGAEEIRRLSQELYHCWGLIPVPGEVEIPTLNFYLEKSFTPKTKEYIKSILKEDGPSITYWRTHARTI